jgi:2'-hydroxyisoflavone reductase
MKILVIGGSKFLGRHLVDAGLDRGHDITMFNRGRLSTETAPGVEYIQGDRHKNLDKLAGRTWDAVVDTCGYLPRSLAISTRALRDAVGNYVFISSISAYRGFSETGMDETAGVGELTDEQAARFRDFDLSQDVTGSTFGETYGPLKAACEKVVRDVFGERALNVRPGLIVGPLDPTDRFSYWVMRVAQGGEFLAPGQPERFVQLIDARDLSDWTVKAIENGASGDFNLNGAPRTTTMGQTIDAIKEGVGSDAEPVWVSEPFLEKEGVQPWSELPLYIPEADPDMTGFMDVSVAKAASTDLKFRPIGETARDTYEWRRRETFPMSAGLAPEREAELLSKWREQVSGTLVSP